MPLSITTSALDLIRSLEAETGSGVRVSATHNILNGSGPAIQLETAPEPSPDDEVVDAEGAVVFLAPSVVALADKILDAAVEEDGRLRFRLQDQESGPLPH